MVLDPLMAFSKHTVHFKAPQPRLVSFTLLPVPAPQRHVFYATCVLKIKEIFFTLILVIKKQTK